MNTISANFSGYDEQGCEPTIATRAAILAMETAGTLVPGCLYCANDITTVAGGTGTFCAFATATNKLSEDGVYEGPFNIGDPYKAELRWLNGQVRYIFDNQRGNTVIGTTAISTFPFGNANVTNNYVEDKPITYTGGVFTANYVKGLGTASLAIVISGGTVSENVFEASGSVNISGGVFSQNKVTTNSTISQTAGTTQRNEFSGGSGFSNSGATFYENRVDSLARVDVTAGIHRANHFANSSIFTQLTANGTCSYTTVANSSVVQTSVPISQSSVDRSGNLRLVNITTGNANFVKVSSGNITINDANSVSLSRLSVSDSSAFISSGASNIVATNSTLGESASVTVTASTLNIQDSTLNNGSTISQLANNMTLYRASVDCSTVTNYGVNSAIRETKIFRAWVYIDQTSSNTSLYYSTVSASSISVRNSQSTGIYYSDVSASAYGGISVIDNVRFTAYYVRSASQGRITATGNTAQQTLYGTSVGNFGQLNFNTNSALNTVVYGCTIEGQAILQLQNCTGAGARGIYYSGIHDYYYLYATQTGGITTGLHAYGRQTYTVTNPPNGTPLRNF